MSWSLPTVGEFPCATQRDTNVCHLRKLTRIDSIFLVFFVVSMQQQIQFNLQYYVTSSFMLLPLTGTTSILSSVIGGAIKLPTAKFVDLIGRAEGFFIMTAFATLGM